LVIANNATAVDSAGIEAERRGYSHAMLCARRSEGPAEEVGRDLARMALRMRDQPGPDCLITGGEPTVKLADIATRGRGGRNQQLALAALEELGDSRGVMLLSGGTDGEDGPTDAAGAWVDEEVIRQANSAGLDAEESLRHNDAYAFFERAGGLYKTGPTGANACDVRVVTVSQSNQ
jgi:hydroxypyruvate reductase